MLLVPRVTELCRKVLEDEGVAGDVTLSEVSSSNRMVKRTNGISSRWSSYLWKKTCYRWRWKMPREIFTWCVSYDDRFYREADEQNGDDTPLFYSSLALMTFQRAFGLFPRILGKGDAAQVSFRGQEVLIKLICSAWPTCYKGTERRGKVNTPIYNSPTR